MLPSIENSLEDSHSVLMLCSEEVSCCDSRSVTFLVNEVCALVATGLWRGEGRGRGEGEALFS